VQDHPNAASEGNNDTLSATTTGNLRRQLRNAKAEILKWY
jgi:hypothetical protein